MAAVSSGDSEKVKSKGNGTCCTTLAAPPYGISGLYVRWSHIAMHAHQFLLLAVHSGFLDSIYDSDPVCTLQLK